jgi:hypothetical protein
MTRGRDGRCAGGRPSCSMYQFSRAIYRELQPDLIGGARSPGARALLAACEETFDRLAQDRHHFAKPERWLFREVRVYFPMESQLRAYTVIVSHVRLAIEYLDRMLAQGLVPEGAVLRCHALTRAGNACQRDPLPGREYCPSHQHLEEDRSLTAA